MWTPIKETHPCQDSVKKHQWTPAGVDCFISNRNCSACPVLQGLSSIGPWGSGENQCKVPYFVQLLLDQGTMPARSHITKIDGVTPIKDWKSPNKQKAHPLYG